MKPTGLFYIFWTFLKLGATAFGGYMSLVALVQKQLVEIDKRLQEEDLLDGISLASVLPGPVAVNVIAYIGYRLRGIGGAIVAFVGIILPSLILVIGLSWVYFTYGNVPVLKNFFLGITPAITALIFSVAVGMARKTIKEWKQALIALVAAILLAVIGGFTLTFILIVVSAIIGYFCFRSSTSGDSSEPPLTRNQWLVIVFIFLALATILLGTGHWHDLPVLAQLLATFSSLSLTLFGGGYVVIPTLHELFVDNLHWLTSAEFADGISIGQVTPGPIFITAAFIGYKVVGVMGAIVATVGMFTPPAILMVLSSHFVAQINGSAAIKSAMKGIRAAVIGMIFASGFTIGQTIAPSFLSGGIFLTTLVVSYKYNVSPIYLILGSGLAGLLIL